MKERLNIRRILVAVDASADSLAAARTAGELAGILQAELAGIFVEDVKLVELSRSPLAHQADLMTLTVQRLEDRELEAQMRAQARRAQRELAQIADRLGIPWTFRVTRGTVSEEILHAATEADLVTLGRLGWSLRSRSLMGKTAQTLLSRPRVRTLLMGPRQEVRPTVAAVYEGSEVGREALQLAAQLSRANHSPLSVFLTGKAEMREKLLEEIRQLKRSADLDLRIEWLGELNAQQLARSVSRRGCRLILFPVGRQLSSQEHLQALLSESDCLVLAIS